MAARACAKVFFFPFISEDSWAVTTYHVEYALAPVRAVRAICAFLQYTVRTGTHERHEQHRDANGVSRRVRGGCRRRLGRRVGSRAREGCDYDSRRDDGNGGLVKREAAVSRSGGSRQKGKGKRGTICWSVYRFPMKRRPRSIDTASPTASRVSSKKSP